MIIFDDQFRETVRKIACEVESERFKLEQAVKEILNENELFKGEIKIIRESIAAQCVSKIEAFAVLNRNRMENEILILREGIKEVIPKISDQNEKIARSEEEIGSLEKLATNYSNEIEALKLKNNDLQVLKRKNEAESETRKSELRSLEEQKNNLRKKIEDLQNEKKFIADHVSSVDYEIKRLKESERYLENEQNHFVKELKMCSETAQAQQSEYLKLESLYLERVKELTRVEEECEKRRSGITSFIKEVEQSIAKSEGIKLKELKELMEQGFGTSFENDIIDRPERTISEKIKTLFRSQK